MTTLRLELGDDETELLGRLAEANPAPLLRSDCNGIALSNLVAIGAAGVGGHRVWISASGLSLWETRTPREDPQ